MRFSLVCGTAGRTTELKRMLASLAGQTYRDFELLLIDQNSDDRALELLDALPKDTSVRRIAASPGLIPALNRGVREATGDVLGFPDDDCWYSPTHLASLHTLLKDFPAWDGIASPAADDFGRPSISRWHTRPGRLTKANAGWRSCSTTMFFRRYVHEKIGGFDESIGGGPLSPSADMDYVHRAVRAGLHIEFRPELPVGHPQTLFLNGLDETSLRKRYGYGFGEGSIARRFSLPLWYSAGILVSPLLRSAIGTVFGKPDEASLEWLTFRARADGYLLRPSSAFSGDTATDRVPVRSRRAAGLQPR